MIIVEGPDGSGKSTLIERLGYERIRFRALRGGIGGDENWGGTQVRAAAAYGREVLRYRGTRTAFDRFHLSEHVYGPVLRNVQELPQAELFRVADFVRHYQVAVVLCLPPFEVTLANVQQEGRERPAYQTDKFLHAAYYGFRMLEPLATIVYDYTKDELPNL